ncbi:MAG: GGDEF domain-containing protein [Pseudomonadota bacterium]
MQLDVDYLCFTLTLACAMYTGIAFTAWRLFIREAYTLCWTIGFVASTLRWGVECLGPETMGATNYYFFVELFALLLIVFASFGHCLRVRDPRTLMQLMVAAGLGFAVLIAATLVRPHTGLREAAVPSVAAISAFLLAAMVFRKRRGTQIAEYALAGTLGLFSLIQAVSAVIAFDLGRNPPPDVLQTHTDFGMLTLPIAYIGIGTVVLFVFSSDLSVKLRGMAIRDQLTGLLNRHGSVESGRRAFEQARQLGQPLSVLVADIDHFKQVNDSFGHAGGDRVLVHIAELLSDQKGGRNVVARLGGEEFLLILPNKPEPTAEEIAERLRAQIESSPAQVGERTLSITASIGVASLLTDDRNIESLIARADRAMYRAKYQGRNQVSVAQSSDDTLSPLTSSPAIGRGAPN